MNVNKLAAHLWGQSIETEAGKLALQVADALRVTGHVVIDPEDRSQVEWLAKVFNGSDGPVLGAVFTDRLQAALREFANPTPPKPEEPTGLGAVVEDASQVEYIHLGSGLWAYGTTDGPSQGFKYADIAAVKILSEGVTA